MLRRWMHRHVTIVWVVRGVTVFQECLYSSWALAIRPSPGRVAQRGACSRPAAAASMCGGVMERDRGGVLRCRLWGVATNQYCTRIFTDRVAPPITAPVISRNLAQL